MKDKSGRRLSVRRQLPLLLISWRGAGETTTMARQVFERSASNFLQDACVPLTCDTARRGGRGGGWGGRGLIGFGTSVPCHLCAANVSEPQSSLDTLDSLHRR